MNQILSLFWNRAVESFNTSMKQLQNFQLSFLFGRNFTTNNKMIHRWLRPQYSMTPLRRSHLRPGANIGRATEALRTELPGFFANGLVTRDIYAPDILFKDPIHSRTLCRSRTTYFLGAEILRWTMALRYEALDFEILQMHPASLEPGTPEASLLQTTSGMAREGLRIRWSLEAMPRVAIWKSEVDPTAVTYEGLFLYAFNTEGLVKEHILEKIHPLPPRLIPCLLGRRTASPAL